MDTAMLYALRDPLGIPAHPVIFLILGVATWALHIAAVHVLLGSSFLAIRGAFSGDDHWRRLASAMVNTAKVAISVAIVVGVAPLLFVQVIYDPFWYTSNVLSAWWVIGFIFILIVATLALFIFYAMNYELRTKKTRCPGSMIVAILLFLVVGFIMHALSVQMLEPDKWLEWYAPNGVIDASGRSIHAYNPWRFAFFIALSLPVIGIWLFGYRRYLQGAGEEDQDYLDFIKRLGTRLGAIGTAISLVLLVIWMRGLPGDISDFATGPWPIAAAVALIIAAAYPLVLGRRLDQGLWGYTPILVATVAMIVVAAMREAIRWVTLFGVHGYNPLDYKIVMDWYSTGLFFITFGVLGGSVVAYLLTVAWQAGQTQGTYTPSRAVNRMGTVSIVLLVLWVAQYFGFGLWTAYA
ncbi:hypothetical protein [Guyparkeria sp.]|uniref:hypothetical protein n=1 Tax=Guyparkeria sp. TaxID=2035736 RepID=UPI00356B3C4F